MPRADSILISHGLVVTMDPERRVISDGAVFIDDRRIAATGKTQEVKRDHKADRKIDAKNKLVMPGLIDAHVHLAQALIRGCADDVALVEWLKNRVWPLQGSFTKEDGETSALLCMLEMIKSGTTTFVESMIHARYGFDGIAKAVQEAGMRAILSKIVMDMPGYGTESSIMHPGMVEAREASVSEAVKMIEKWNGKAGGRIRVWFGPRSLGACTRDLYQEVVALAAKHKTGITMHLAEVQDDVRYAEKEFGKRPVQFARDVGLLAPNTLLAHMVWLTDSEIDSLSEAGAHVCHCPSSNLKLASGMARVPEMLRARVNVALGCDGGPSNNCYDMIREMKLAALLHKGRLIDPTVIPAETALEMATINGARALGLEKTIGSIEEGKAADIILIDLAKPHLKPNHNPISNLVYSATGADVSTVIIDGKVVMENGVVKTIKEREILRRAEEQAKKVLSRADIRIPQKWPTV